MQQTIATRTAQILENISYQFTTVVGDIDLFLFMQDLQDFDDNGRTVGNLRGSKSALHRLPIL